MNSLQDRKNKQFRHMAQYMDALLRGDRVGCRGVVEDILHTGMPANGVYLDVVWPVMVEVEQLFRADKITSAQEHFASRINRTIVDQLQNKLPRKESRNKKIVTTCAGTESAELGAQIMTDLLESDGWEVRFLGAGVSNDEILEFIGDYRPDVLMIYGTVPQDAPEVRRLIDTIKEVNSLPDMKVMVSGGLFNRAEGLWEEIGADMFAGSPKEAVDAVNRAWSGELPEPVRTINVRGRKAPVRMKKIRTELTAQVAGFGG
ncbi:MAG TPA: cobalamin-dependent protein [Sedimentisphaerales bacterium]|nr:cobalamin-dependent protein [Sedimentisphaerales bacterium]